MTPLDDDAFLAAVSAGERPGGRFDHLDHVRLAWIVVRRDGALRGEARVAELLRHLATAQGAAARYHETLTRAWVRLVVAALQDEPHDRDFAGFVAAHPELARRSLLERHYSAERLASPSARQGWIAPDRAPLPAPSTQAGDADRHGARERRLRNAFLLGAATDALAVLAMSIPTLSVMLWGSFADRLVPDRFVLGLAASSTAAWTALLLWASRLPVERAFVAPLTVLVIDVLLVTEITAMLRGDLAPLRMVPTLLLQGTLLWLLASAYHGWRLPGRDVASA